MPEFSEISLKYAIGIQYFFPFLKLPLQETLEKKSKRDKGDRKKYAKNENRYAMTFGGDYDFKDGAESMILPAPPAESMILSVRLL
jgi:hypothetical protein